MIIKGNFIDLAINPNKIESKYHEPDEVLRKYITELSLMSRERQEKQLRGKELDHKQKVRIKNLANRKVKVLNEIIFPSMANLTFFFKAIEKDGNLEDTFNSDIKDLLGIRRSDPTASNYAFMFASLIEGMIGLSGRSEDFRLRLIHKLQEIIYYKVQHTGKDESYILETKDASFRIFEDIQRALVWTALLASRIKDENIKPGRTFNSVG